MIHNIDARVAKCPMCNTRIYKPDGCNHMACSRCRGAFCWICRRDISEAHYDHFSPDNMFGCNGMTEIPQCILCWVFLLLLMIGISPIATAIKMGNILGKHIIGKIATAQTVKNISGRQREVYFAVIYMFGLGIIYLPIVLLMTLVMWPPIFVYKVWVLLGVVVRNFLCCCIL